MRIKLLGWLLAGAVCSCAYAQTAPINDATLPAALREWRPWVMKGLEYRSCPFIATTTPAGVDTFVCAWPGKLLINADAKGATFNQHWRVEAQEWIALPGDNENWPQELTVNGQRFPVSLFNGAPALRLDPGSYEIHARIPWSERPQSLRVPDTIGLVELSVDGKVISPLERNGESLTLGRAASGAAEAESLSLRVFRKISDGLPPTLDTKIEFDVAGPGRESVLGPILPQDFVATALDGELPARLDPDGKLHIQLRPGTWTLDVSARASTPLSNLTVKLGAEPWPMEEIWSYESVPGLRVTSADSAVPIDPAQAGVPEEWRSLPAFAMQEGSSISIEERARGLAATDTNRLHLQREAWLDFAGTGLFAKDRIQGRMVRDWRLDVAAPFTLTRAQADGEGLLITRQAKTDVSGVELRNPNINVSAGVHIDAAGGSLPITGWQQTFDSVGLTLHLPYGYRLLGAPGADTAYGTWMARWTLLDVFIVAIIALLGWRLFGLIGGLAGLLYLVLGYQEPGAPLWALGAVMVFELITRALPVGKLARFSNALVRIALVVLVLTALPFMADQVRFALYPQLESAPTVYNRLVESERFRAVPQSVAPYKGPAEVDTLNEPEQQTEMSIDDKDESRPAAPVMASPKPMLDGGLSGKELPRTQAKGKFADLKKANSLGNAQSSWQMKRYAENTNIQAGRGEPGWQYGSTYALSWSGPVASTQEVRLVIAPPWLVRSLRLMLVALLVFVAARLFGRGISSRISTPTARAAGIITALFIIGGGFTFSTAKAQGAPSQELLNELRTRLIEAPKCAPSCALLAWAKVDAQGDNLHFALEAQTAERVALPLPSDEKTLTLKSVSLDGVAQDGMLRKNGQLWLTVARGVHRIEMAFTVVAVDKVSLPFPLKPVRVEFSGSGWEAGGISEDRLLTETLDLIRMRESGSEPAAGTTQQFPPYVQLTRNIKLDLDWEVENNVQRLAPQEGGFSVELGLLKSEHVTTAQLKVKDNRITVPMPDGEDEASWSSQLDKSDVITLTAPAISDHAEIWKITQSPNWHADFSGVPAVQPQDSANYWTHEFHPLPGETLTIKIDKPEPVAGPSLAIDSASVVSQVGTRATEHTLTLSIRSTQGGEHVIELPLDAEILGVTKNGLALNLRPRDGKLSLPITPATQNFAIRWRENREIGAQMTTPQVKLNSAAANINLQLGLPADRWILMTTGPVVGPAVLYWGELLVMIVLAIGLARLRRTPLQLWHWLLLGIGFSTFSWSALLLVVAWLLALDWRKRYPLQRDGWFNLMQLALVLITAGALVCLIGSIPFGLLGQPDMHLSGNGSLPTALRWFADQSTDTLPQASALSLPLWGYKLTMLLWALWLANALIGWLRWGFAAWSHEGYWRSAPKKHADVTTPASST